MQEFIGILFIGVGAAGVAGILLWASSVLGPKKPNPVKAQPFETGMQPFSIPQGHLTVKFYVLAVLFVIFDVELVFLLPWAIVFRELGWFAWFEMVFFLSFVVLAFVYAWKKGAFQWT